MRCYERPVSCNDPLSASVPYPEGRWVARRGLALPAVVWPGRRTRYKPLTSATSRYVSIDLCPHPSCIRSFWAPVYVSGCSCLHRRLSAGLIIPDLRVLDFPVTHSFEIENHKPMYHKARWLPLKYNEVVLEELKRWRKLVLARLRLYHTLSYLYLV